MVGTTLAIKREMEDAQGIRDASAGGKRKEDQPSSSLEKRQRIFVPRVPQVQGQPGPMTCFYYHRPGHMKRDCPLRYGVTTQIWGIMTGAREWEGIRPPKPVASLTEILIPTIMRSPVNMSTYLYNMLRCQTSIGRDEISIPHTPSSYIK